MRSKPPAGVSFVTEPGPGSRSWTMKVQPRAPMHRRADMPKEGRVLETALSKQRPPQGEDLFRRGIEMPRDLEEARKQCHIERARKAFTMTGGAPKVPPGGLWTTTAIGRWGVRHGLHNYPHLARDSWLTAPGRYIGKNLYGMDPSEPLAQKLKSVKDTVASPFRAISGYFADRGGADQKIQKTLRTGGAGVPVSPSTPKPKASPKPAAKPTAPKGPAKATGTKKTSAMELSPLGRRAANAFALN